MVSAFEAGSAEIRDLGPTGIEDYHAHLLRQDRFDRFPGSNPRAVDTYCLSLIAAGAILLGAFVGGALRAVAEIVPDRTGCRARATISVDPGFDGMGLECALTDRILGEARRYGFQELSIHDRSTSRSYKLATASIAGWSGYAASTT